MKILKFSPQQKEQKLLIYLENNQKITLHKFGKSVVCLQNYPIGVSKEDKMFLNIKRICESSEFFTRTLSPKGESRIYPTDFDRNNLRQALNCFVGKEIRTI